MRGLRARTVLVTIVLLLPVISAIAATPEEEVRSADARRIAAVVDGNVGALSALLADDLTYTHTTGQVENKEQFLAGLASGKLDYQSIQPSEVQVRVYGNSAVMTGRAEMKVNAQGKDLAFAIRFTSVWVKGEGGWRMAAWQSTRLP
ncbi:MAG TPA: nuclear transport factor 2 family protein [Thermoanaerobaculia bacterium]|nr:nuclear transport factor 2 family protein [Thermoanaerobaculia bacterium]